MGVSMRSAAFAFLLVGLSAWAGGPPRVPNAVKYRGAESRHLGKARIGGASLEARALRAKDGSTLLELSTAPLDAGIEAPGSIRMAQVKGFDALGRLRYFKAYPSLGEGGYIARLHPDLERDQPLQVQALIEGADGSRAEMVSAQIAVGRRPDLSVENLLLPARVQVHHRVNLAATVRELNSDVGARAHAVLYVDGLEADRAEDLWVAPGGTVSVAFSHRFDAPGRHAVAVRLERVRPADWDEGNQTASGVLEVAEAPTPLSYYASVNDYDHRRVVQERHAYGYANGTQLEGSDWFNRYTESGWDHESYFQFSHNARAFRFPVAAASLQESTDGRRVANLQLQNLPADYDSSWSAGGLSHREQGAYAYDAATNAYLYFSTYAITDEATQLPIYATSFGTVTRYAGEVTYHSIGYSLTWDGSVGSFYTWNDRGGAQGGLPRVTLGRGYAMDFWLTDAAGEAYHAQAHIQLQPYDITEETPWSCTTSQEGAIQYFNCASDYLRRTGKSGSAYDDRY